MPMAIGIDGSSPSARPAATGTAAASSPVIGATTLIGPMASAP